MFLAIDAAFCSAELRDHCRVDDPGLDHRDDLARVDVQALALLGASDLVDDDRAPRDPR
jgi:hypothetical protein